MNPVLKNVRASLAAQNSREPYPEWKDDSIIAPARLTQPSLVESFESNLQAVHGIAMHSANSVGQYLNENQLSYGYCAPGLEEFFATSFPPGITFDTDFDKDRYDSYAFGITRATAAIAESGSLVLTDKDTACRLGALTPWVHIAVLQKSTIVRSIGDAIALLSDDPNTIWVTGPSKTADVEGILIQGVHGPGVQIALIV